MCRQSELEQLMLACGTKLYDIKETHDISFPKLVRSILYEPEQNLNEDFLSAKPYVVEIFNARDEIHKVYERFIKLVVLSCVRLFNMKYIHNEAEQEGRIVLSDIMYTYNGLCKFTSYLAKAIKRRLRVLPVDYCYYTTLPRELYILNGKFLNFKEKNSLPLYEALDKFFIGRKETQSKTLVLFLNLTAEQSRKNGTSLRNLMDKSTPEPITTDICREDKERLMAAIEDLPEDQKNLMLAALDTGNWKSNYSRKVARSRQVIFARYKKTVKDIRKKLVVDDE